MVQIRMRIYELVSKKYDKKFVSECTRCIVAPMSYIGKLYNCAVRSKSLKKAKMRDPDVYCILASTAKKLKIVILSCSSHCQKHFPSFEEPIDMVYFNYLFVVLFVLQLINFFPSFQIC